MLSNIGIIFLILTLTLSILLIYYSLSNLNKNKKIIDKNIYYLSLYQTTFCILSFFVLLLGFIFSDFSLINVFENSHTNKPFFYKITGTWGSHEGSLLLWINILVIFSYLFLIYNKNKDISFRFYTIIFQNFLIIGFLIFLLINSNPFSIVIPVPKEGLGLNPILQDPALAIHPPLLYVGFVGSSIYFSAAMASLVSGFRGKPFATSIKPWILISWSFQTLGIVVGSIWAYYELGWGGFWFWDPVENASLMPWFVMTALMHSVIVLEKRNSIYSWVIILCLLTFTLSVTGTFLVRSGVLNSVHTFANDPSRGIYILMFLSIMIFSALIIFFKNYKKENYNFHTHSKETYILFNNWFMFFFLTSVLIGTLYPLFLEVLTDTKISVGPPFYNTLIVPVTVIFLVLMAIGPNTSWIKGSYKNFLFATSALTLSVILNFIIYNFFGKYSLLSNLIIISSIFLIIHSIYDCLKMFQKSIKYDPSRIISHFGFGLLVFFIGINHNYSIEKDFNLRVGEIKNFQNYSINFVSLEKEDRKNYTAIVGNFRILDKKNSLSENLKPEIRIYDNPETLTYEASIRTKIYSDKYITMSNISRSDFYNIKFQEKPFMIWIWISAVLISAGGVIRIFRREVLT